MQQIILIFVLRLCFSLKIDYESHLSHLDHNFIDDSSQFDKSKVGHSLLKLHSIQDLPSFIQSGQVYNKQGLNMLTKFLTEDDDVLQRNGGIYDETGFDGLDSNEEQQPFGSELRNRQRARSAANIYQKESNQVDIRYDAYGCTVDKEKLNDWFIYIVLLMSQTGKHKLNKVCIPKIEEHKIAFVIQTDKKCADVVQHADKFEQKSENYLERSGILGKIQQSQQYQDLVKSKKILTPPGLFNQIQSGQSEPFKIRKDDQEVIMQKEKLAKLQVFKEIQQQINTLQKTLLNVATEQIQPTNIYKKYESISSFIQTKQTNKSQENDQKSNNVSEVQQLKQEIQSMKQNQENFIKQLMQQFKMPQVQLPLQQKDNQQEQKSQIESKEEQKVKDEVEQNQQSQTQTEEQQTNQKQKEENEKMINIYKQREEKQKAEDISLDLADLIKQRIDQK